MNEYNVLINIGDGIEIIPAVGGARCRANALEVYRNHKNNYKNCAIFNETTKKIIKMRGSLINPNPSTVYPLYRAELSDPNSEDRFEIFRAKDDDDAFEISYSFVTSHLSDDDGIVLLEIHLLNESYDYVRNVIY